MNSATSLDREIIDEFAIDQCTHTYTHMYIYICVCVCVCVELKGLQSHDKAVVKAAHLGESNFKIKTREGSFSIKPLLICRYPLIGKVQGTIYQPLRSGRI